MTLKLNQLLAIAALAATAFAGSTTAQAADVGVSVSISQPGVYGRVDIGRFPQPSVFVQQPVIVQRVVQVREPVYMWVPPGHRKNWSGHCAQYRACGSPVYFVRDDWYDQKVRHPGPRHDMRRDDRGGPRHDARRDDRGNKHEDRRGGRHGRDH